jgi:hypothetical protein
MAYSYTGRRLIADVLEDITGLTEWVDYFPVQYDETTDTATKEGALIITDEGGTGDNHPVFLVTGRTHPFRCSAVGYVPIIDAPAFPDVPASVLEVLATYDNIATPNATSHSVKLPAVDEGDLLVMLVGFGSSRALSSIPAGWNMYRSAKPWRAVTAAINTAAVLWTVATSDAAATTVSLSFSGSCYLQAVVLRVAKDTFHPYHPIDLTTEDIITTTGTVAAAGSITPPTLTPVWGEKLTRWIPFSVFQKAAAGGNLKVAEVADEASYQPSTTSTAVYGIGLYQREVLAASVVPYDFVYYNVATPATTSMFADYLAIQPKPGVAPAVPEALPAVGVTMTNNNSQLAISVVSYPATVNAGDLLVCVFANSTTRTAAVPGDWTTMGAVSIEGIQKHYIFYKIATGTEGGGTFTVTQSGTGYRTAIVLRIEPTVFNNSGSFIEKPTFTSGTSKVMACPVGTPSWGSGSETLFIPIASMYKFAGETRSFPYYNAAVTYEPTSYNGASAVGISVDMKATTTTSESPGNFRLTDYGLTDRDWVADTLMIKLI